MRIPLFVLRRLILMVPILLGITLVAFCMTRVLPSDPLYSMLGPYATEEDLRMKREELGLDRPLLAQYLIYLQDLLHGELGTSYRTGQPVLQDLKQRMPVTFELTTISLLIAVSLSLPLGVVAAVKKDTWLDHLLRTVSVAGISIPLFWSGVVLIFIFYFNLHIFPAPLGRLDPLMRPPPTVTGMYTIDALVAGDWLALKSSLMHLTLPLVTLTFAMMAPLLRMTRNNTLECLNARYVTAALALGVPFRSVVFRDALRNALLPVITNIGLIYGWSLGGEVLVEAVFSWPGMGYYAVNSIMNLDYASVQGFVLLTAIIYVIVNLLVDVLYAVIDPRIKY